LAVLDVEVIRVTWPDLVERDGRPLAPELARILAAKADQTRC